MNIGVRIKELREKSGFTQKNVSDYLNVDQSLISKVEKGERSLTSDMIDKIASLLGVPVTAICNDEDCYLETECAFRASELSIEDLKTISIINKIALNTHLMTKLMEE